MTATSLGAVRARSAAVPVPLWWSGFVPGLLLAVFLLGYYVHADLPLGGAARLPAAGAVLGGLGLLAWHLGRLWRGDLVFAGMAVAVTAASLALNPAFWEGRVLAGHAGGYATAYLGFLVSLAMALGAIVALRRLGARGLARLAGAGLALVLAGVAAERYLGLDTVSEAARQVLFPAEIVYAADLRDRLMYGGVRAKLFTSEPSHVGKFFVLLLLVWYGASRSRWRVPLLYFVLAAGVVLVQSPGLLIALPAVWVCDLCRYRRRRWVWVLALAGAVAAVVAVALGQAMFAERLEHIASGRDGSFLIRVLLPLEVWLRVWAEHPVFGLGFGAKESGIPYALQAAADMKLDVAVLLGTTAPLGNNGVLIALIQLGAFGALLLAVAMAWYWWLTAGGNWPFVAASVACYLSLIGGINDPRFWGGFALLTAAGTAARTVEQLGEQLGERRPWR